MAKIVPYLQIHIIVPNLSFRKRNVFENDTEWMQPKTLHTTWWQIKPLTFDFSESGIDPDTGRQLLAAFPDPLFDEVDEEFFVLLVENSGSLVVEPGRCVTQIPIQPNLRVIMYKGYLFQRKLPPETPMKMTL